MRGVEKENRKGQGRAEQRRETGTREEDDEIDQKTKREEGEEEIEQRREDEK